MGMYKFTCLAARATLYQLILSIHYHDLSTWSSLQVVSTRVGGVPEVLPPELIRLAEPNVTGTHTLLDIIVQYLEVQRSSLLITVYIHM